MVEPHNNHVIGLILMIVSIPTIPEMLASVEPLKHALPAMAKVCFSFSVCGTVFPELSKHVILCHVLKKCTT